MSRLYQASSDGWKARTQGPVTPPSQARGRLIEVAASTGVVTPPTGGGGPTVFGYNPNAPEGDFLRDAFGRTPIARCYTGSLSTDGSWFNPGGFAYTSANVGVAGHVSGKRLNMSFTGFTGSAVTSSSSPVAVQAKNFAASVPAGWIVQFVMYHEWNLHTTDGVGDGSAGSTMAQWVNAFRILAQAIIDGDAGRGRCIPVMNPSWDQGAFQDISVPNASTMPVGTELHFDIYDNPSGQPKGYKAYGTTYKAAATLLQPMYDTVVRLGYTRPGYGWGVDEISSPRRVGLKLATLDTTLGWGPLSPQDDDGSGMAQSLTAMGNFLYSCPVKPTTIIYFTGTGAWNQGVRTAGTAAKDGTGANRRGFPMNVDPTKPLNALKALMALSAP